MNPTKYDIPEEDIVMASESVAAYNAQPIEHVNSKSNKERSATLHYLGMPFLAGLSRKEKVMVIEFLAHSLTEEGVNDVNKEQLMQTLYTFQEYSDGWDGNDALPLQPLSVSNFRGAISLCDDSVLGGWQLSPETNGTLMLTTKDGNTGINIGDATYSYFHINDGNLSGESNIAFNPNAVADIIKEFSV